MTNHPRSTIKVDRRSGRVSRRKSASSLCCEGGRRRHKYAKDKNGMDHVNKAARIPELTADGKRHRELFAKWAHDPNRETFAEFILSRYC